MTLVTLPSRMAEKARWKPRFTGADFLPDALGGDDVGVNTHADAEDDTGDAGQGQGEGGDIGEDAGDRGHHNHHLAGQGKDAHKAGKAVLQKHKQSHQHKGDRSGLDHNILCTQAQGGGDGAVVPGIQAEGQGSALDLLGQVLRLLIGKGALDDALAPGNDGVDLGVRDQGIIHPDGYNAPQIPLGGCGKGGGALGAQFKGDHIFIGAGGLVLGSGHNGLHQVPALQDNGGVGASLLVDGKPLPEGEKGGIPQFPNGLLGVVFGFPCLPGEADDDPVLGGIGIDLVIGNALGDQAGADHLGGRLHLLVGGVVAIRGGKGGIHASPDIDAPADIRRTFNIGGCQVPVGDADPEEGKVRCRQNNDGDSEKGP